MEEMLAKAFDSGDLKTLIVCAILYVVIYVQRTNTKKIRDEKTDDTDKRISVLESKFEKIDELDLAARLSAIETSLKYIQMLLENKNK